jgi:hypothetical protein
VFGHATKQSEVIARSHGTLLYCGRPGWLNSDQLAVLVAEAASLRESAKQINERKQMGVAVGGEGKAFALSTALNSLIEQFAGPVEFTADANYLYYEQEGAGIDPHIDRVEFSLQVLLMLEHEGYHSSRSSLALFPEGGPAHAIFIPLEPGEFVLFRAASVIHGRTPVASGETVRLLGIGYRSAAA